MKRLIFFILSFGYFSIIKAQAGSQNFNSAIGKTFTFKKINEIEAFRNYKEYDGVAITGSKEQHYGFTNISDDVRTQVLFTKYSGQGYKILAILDIGKIEKNMRIFLQGVPSEW